MLLVRYGRRWADECAWRRHCNGLVPLSRILHTRATTFDLTFQLPLCYCDEQLAPLAISEHQPRLIARCTRHLTIGTQPPIKKEPFLCPNFVARGSGGNGGKLPNHNKQRLLISLALHLA